MFRVKDDAAMVARLDGLDKVLGRRVMAPKKTLDRNTYSGAIIFMGRSWDIVISSDRVISAESSATHLLVSCTGLPTGRRPHDEQ